MLTCSDSHLLALITQPTVCGLANVSVCRCCACRTLSVRQALSVSHVNTEPGSNKSASACR